MKMSDPTPVHAQKRGKNFAMLAILVAWIVLLFGVTLVKIAQPGIKKPPRAVFHLK